MILLLISLILLALKCFHVIEWSWWIVAAPVLAEGLFAYWIFMKTEFEYLKEYNNKSKEEPTEE